jgi:hypothetical protein
MAGVTTWNIVPNYDEWGSDSYWSCEDWVQWHKLLKEHFGEERAKYIWEFAYNKGTDGASHLDCRTSNNAFRKYASAEKLDMYSSAGLFSIILKPIGVGFDIVNDTSDAISGISSDIADFFNSDKVSPIKVLLWGTTFIALGFVGYQAYKYSKK